MSSLYNPIMAPTSYNQGPPVTYGGSNQPLVVGANYDPTQSMPPGMTSATPPGFSSPVNVPSLSTLLNQTNAYNSSQFMTPAALANQAQVAAAGLPGNLQGNLPGLGGQSYGSLTNDQQTALLYNALYGNGGVQGGPLQGPALMSWLNSMPGANTMANAPLNSFQSGGPFANVPGGLTGTTQNTPYTGPGAPAANASGAYNPSSVPGSSAAPGTGPALPGAPGTSAPGSTAPPISQQQPAASNPFASPTGNSQSIQSLLQSLFSNPQNQTGTQPTANAIQGSNPLSNQPLFSSATPNAAAPAAGTSSSVDQTMGANANDIGYLQQVASGGMPTVDSTPAWQAMVQAQQRNIQEGQANLNEQFNAAGGRYSTSYGTAATDYQNQATANQNSLLGQMQLQSMLQSQGMTYGAAQQLGQFGQQNLSQLSSQDFQSKLQQYGLSAQMAQQLFGAGTGAAGGMAQLGALGAGALQQGALTGAQGLFGAENTAGLTAAQQALSMMGMGSQAAGQLSNLYGSNLGLGNQLGQTQYTDLQNAISNSYSGYQATQPYNNPMLGQLLAIATGYPQLAQSTYQPGWLGSVLSGVGSIVGGAAMFSDIRLKENLEPTSSLIGDALDLNTYNYNYKGDPTPHTGFIAQEVARKYPTAVYRTPYDLLVVDYGKLFAHALGA